MASQDTFILSGTHWSMTTHGRQHFVDVMKGRNPRTGEMIIDYLGGLNPIPGALKSGRGKQRSGLESLGITRTYHGFEEKGSGL